MIRNRKNGPVSCGMEDAQDFSEGQGLKVESFFFFKEQSLGVSDGFRI